MDVIKPGDHGSTFGGNPLASAIGIAALDVIIEEQLPKRAYELGNWFMDELRRIQDQKFKEVRGKGLLIGIELAEKARPYCERLMDLGILAKETHDMVVRFAPPLIIKKDELKWALDKIEQVFNT